MTTVTFVLGLCASGKSHIANKLEQKGAKKYDEGFAATPELFDNNARNLADMLKNGRDCVVVEIALCQEQMREKIVRFL